MSANTSPVASTATATQGTDGDLSRRADLLFAKARKALTLDIWVPGEYEVSGHPCAAETELAANVRTRVWMSLISCNALELFGFVQKLNFTRNYYVLTYY